MARYRVIMTETIAHYYLVEADSEDEAQEKAYEGDYEDEDSKELGTDIFEIQKLKKNEDFN